MILEILQDCKLKVLDLSHNEFGERGGVILGPALSTNVYLDTLDLSWNQIRGVGAVSIARGLKVSLQLFKLAFYRWLVLCVQHCI